jgi:D-sedoheptulose 7-phosphate isomerase
MSLDELKKCLSEINTENLNNLKVLISSNKKIIILGNGGSNAISSHIAQDYTKALGKFALSFSDSSRLTCYINDYGMENAYVKFIEHFGDTETIVILISSSGNSLNIINAAKYCIGNNIKIITLSGFKKNNIINSLSNKSLLSFWVDSEDYGIVELTHEAILHSVI